MTTSSYDTATRTRPSWAAGDLHERALECRDRLCAHILGHVSSDGAVRDRCGSRVLESALMLHLLQAEGVYPGAQRAIGDYLDIERGKRTSSADGLAVFETALIDAATGTADRHDPAALSFLDNFAHFTNHRKRFMFATLLAELGGAPADDAFDLAAVGYDEYATWVNLEMCALKIMNAHQRGRPDLVTPADRAYLLTKLATGSARGIWDADVFAHLVALLGLRRIEPGSVLMRDGIQALLRSQNPDGGFPFIAGWEPFLTAVAGYGLARAGASPARLRRMGDFLGAHQGPDGGWPYAPRVHQSDADCSPFCTAFLRAVDPVRYERQIAKAEEYLVALANPDGGFGTYRRGDDSEVGVTGCTVCVLAPSRDRYPGLIEAAVGYLLDKQQPDGTFERGWSLSEANAIMRAMFAFGHCPPGSLSDRVTAAIAASADYLAATHNADGGWGQRPGDPSDVLSTAYSLLAIGRRGPASALRDGLEYLLAHQDGDGGFTSIPDSAGPRPFPHDAPVLADAFPLIALNHLLDQP